MAARHAVWEYAVMQVDWTYQDDEFEYRVIANSGEKTIYEDTIRASYWSVPLSRMGQMGWELVGLNPQNVLAQGFLPGYTQAISTPVRMAFFFKRPQLD